MNGGGPKKSHLLKICYSHRTIMKFDTVVKEDARNIKIPWDTSWILLTLAFFTKNFQFLLYADVIFVHDVTNKILPHHSIYIVDYSRISMTEVVITSNFSRIWPKKRIFWRMVLVQVQSFRAGSRYDPEVLQCYGKSIKTNSSESFEG